MRLWVPASIRKVRARRRYAASKPPTGHPHSVGGASGALAVVRLRPSPSLGDAVQWSLGSSGSGPIWLARDSNSMSQPLQGWERLSHRNHGSPEGTRGSCVAATQPLVILCHVTERGPAAFRGGAIVRWRGRRTPYRACDFCPMRARTDSLCSIPVPVAEGVDPWRRGASIPLYQAPPQVLRARVIVAG